MAAYNSSHQQADLLEYGLALCGSDNRNSPEAIDTMLDRTPGLTVSLSLQEASLHAVQKLRADYPIMRGQEQSEALEGGRSSRTLQPRYGT